MANQSIYNAFERMWQHVVNVLPTKVSQLTNDENYIKEDYDLVISTDYNHEIFEVEYGSVSAVYDKYVNNIIPRVLLKVNFVYGSDYQNFLYESNSVHVYFGSGKQVRINFEVMKYTYSSKYSRANKQSIIVLFNGDDINTNTVSGIAYVKEDDTYDSVINFEMPYGSWTEQMQIENFSFASDDISRIYRLLKDNKPVKVLLKGTLYMGTGSNYISNIIPTDVYIENSSNKRVFINFVIDNTLSGLKSILYSMRFEGDANDIYTLVSVENDYEYNIPHLNIDFAINGDLDSLSTSNINYTPTMVINMWNYLLENNNYADSNKYNINLYGTTDLGSGGFYYNKLNISHIEIDSLYFNIGFTYGNYWYGGVGQIQFNRRSSDMTTISNVSVNVAPYVQS